MRIAVLGGGPAGLYFAYLWRKRHPNSHIVLFEQNPADATWGFGVVFSERALDFLRADDPDTADSFAPHMETWQDVTLVLRGEHIAIDGVGFSAVGRLDLLSHLQRRARSVGVTLRFNTTVRGLDELTRQYPS
jgi:2-polyprenyl-6-methoxyphenol hydroxylase-like FAD-dependent oxidoreductase